MDMKIIGARGEITKGQESDSKLPRRSETMTGMLKKIYEIG